MVHIIMLFYFTLSLTTKAQILLLLGCYWKTSEIFCHNYWRCNIHNTYWVLKKSIDDSYIVSNSTNNMHPYWIQGGPKKSVHLYATKFNITQIPLLTYIWWQNVHKWKGYTREGLFFSVSALSCHDYFQTTSENVTGLLDIVFCHFGPISSNRLFKARTDV